MSPEGRSLLDRLLSRQPRPVRDLYSGEAPEWADKTSGRPSHFLSLQARLAQSRVVPLDEYRIQNSRRQLTVVAELPGVKASEILLAVDPGLLTICTEAVPGTDDHASDPLWQLCRDMRRGKYSQTLELPDGLQVDRWSATFEDGVLRIRIPKAA